MLVFFVSSFKSVFCPYLWPDSRCLASGFAHVPHPPSGQWIESVTDWAIRITDWGLFPDWVSSHARLADPIRPMPNNGKSRHSGLPIALISRLPDWVVQSVLPIAIHRLLHRFYPLASLPYDASSVSSHILRTAQEDVVNLRMF